MLRAVGEVLEAEPDLELVYSIGGGNTAVLQAFGDRGRAPRAFVGHDLDEDNLTLLRRHQISAVLHHDLRADARQACRLLLQWNGALPGRASSAPSAIQVVTPYNVPLDAGRRSVRP
jgi:LacI family transcriptional regulator